MNKDTNDVSVDSPSAVRVEVANRRQQLCNTILRNFEVARLNVRDTQISPDAALIDFYEGATLSIPLPSQDTAERPSPHPKGERDLSAALGRLRSAERLFQYADGIAALEQPVVGNNRELLIAFWTVAFHAKFNAIVLDHRQVATHNKTFRAVGEVLKQYEALHRELQLPKFSSAQQELIGVQIATVCGLISCLCSQLQMTHDQEMLPMILDLTGKIISTKKQIQNLLARASEKGKGREDISSIESCVRASLERVTADIDIDKAQLEH